MEFNKYAMLCDVQYVKYNKKENLPDYLYIIWRDTLTGEKYLKIIPSPKMTIYFEKDEYRNHKYSKNHAPIETLYPVTTEYRNIPRVIASEWLGPEQANVFFQNAYQTRDYNSIKNLFLYPYVYGADYDVETFYRIKWLREMNNDIPKKLRKGFLDIEVDVIDDPGLSDPKTDPINAVTLIDDYDKQVYTFVFTHREFIPKNCNKRTSEEREILYNQMYEQQDYLENHLNEFKKKLHDMFDESYGLLDYNVYFYKDEKQMLVHLFQLINKLKLDFIGIWNMSFDIPYIMDRLTRLGLDPASVMCHPDFPSKVCYFKHDRINHAVKNKSDNFHISSYTVFYDDMELYAAIRKGSSELRSYKLNNIANHELKDTKLDYTGSYDKLLPYTNFEKFVIYNIKDVLLQMGIERRTSDFDTLYTFSYENATSYDKVFKQTVKLRNVEYLSFLDQGLIPGENTNIFNKEDKKKVSDDDDEDEEGFEGALVADPEYNDYIGISLYGKPTNNVFNNGIDFDMSAFYPNSIMAMNIDPSTLIFKMIMPMEQFKPYGGKLPFNGITKDYFSASDDGSKECIDNFQTGNYVSMGHKWMGLPSINKIYNILKNERSE